jgi:hypothetical protein
MQRFGKNQRQSNSLIIIAKKGWCEDGHDEDHPGFGPIGTAWVELMVGCVG